MPDEPEAVGLLALMLLTDARRPARTAADGTMVRLADQDRATVGPRPDRPRATAWCGPACAATTRARTRSRPPSPPSTPTPSATRRPTGPRSSPCTTSSTRCRPNPIVALNRAVAIAELHGAGAGLADLEALDADASRRATSPTTPPGPTSSLAPAAADEARRRLRPGHRAHHQPRRSVPSSPANDRSPSPPGSSALLRSGRCGSSWPVARSLRGRVRWWVGGGFLVVVDEQVSPARGVAAHVLIGVAFVGHGPPRLAISRARGTGRSSRCGSGGARRTCCSDRVASTASPWSVILTRRRRASPPSLPEETNPAPSARATSSTVEWSRSWSRSASSLVDGADPPSQPRTANSNWCWLGVTPAPRAASSENRRNRRSAYRNRARFR